MQQAWRLAVVFMAHMGASSALVGQYSGAPDNQPISDSRTEAPQIYMSDNSANVQLGRAYLDTAAKPPVIQPAQQIRANNDQIYRGESNTPTRQISSRVQGGPMILQLSKVDLESTLSQLTAAERRVLLQAIEGSDICDAPPDIPAVLALCQTRIETRAADFASRVPPAPSAEDGLLRGDLETTTLPTITQVIDRLARSSASTENFSNQAIASIALGTTPTVRDASGGEDQANVSGLGEEAQAFITALINQLGGQVP
jgi:hypothetical protein